MLWPVLGGDDGLSPTASLAPATGAVPPVKGVNKLAPLLLCAPCKPSSHRKCQSSTQWYVQQVKKRPDGWCILYITCGLRSASFHWWLCDDAFVTRALLEGTSGLVCGFRRDYQMITYRIRDKIISFRTC